MNRHTPRYRNMTTEQLERELDRLHILIEARRSRRITSHHARFIDQRTAAENELIERRLRGG